MEEPAEVMPESAEVDGELDVELDQESPEGEDPGEPEVDEEEIEHDGEKFKVPKKLKEAFLRQSDYTKKTQEVAEQRKAVEAEREAVKIQAAMHQQYIQEVAEVVSVNKQIEQYQAVNWEELINSDPVQAMKYDRQMRELIAKRDELAGSITQKHQQQELERQQFAAKQLQEANATVEREIPGWGPELHKELRERGKAIGYTDNELDNAIDPRAWKLLHKAHMYDKLMAKQTAKPKPESQEKPVTRIAATKNSGKKDPAQMTDREFAEFRRKQIANRNK